MLDNCLLNFDFFFRGRLKAGNEADLEEIEAEMKCKLEKVVWLHGFYSIPPDIKIANSKAYKEGKVTN